jgi:hypothetical protein
MPVSPFETWTAKDAAAKIAENTAYTTHKLLFDGDHWQGGAQWVGPLPPQDAPGYQETLTAIRKSFVSKNAIRETVGRHSAAVIGNEPIWAVTVARALVDDEVPTPQEQTLIDAAEAALTTWWDMRGAIDLLHQATRAVLLGGTPLLRLYVPQGLLENGAVPRGTLDESLNRIYLDVIAPTAGVIYSDPDTKLDCGIVQYQRDDGTTITELSYIDPDTTFTILKLFQGSEVQETALDFGGRLPVWALERDAFITEQVVQMQNLLNMALTMLGRNVVLAGFVERTIFNAEMPGEWLVDPATGKKTFKPAPFHTGAGAVNVLRGIQIEQDSGSTTLATPAIVYRDPVSVTTFAETRREAYVSILEETHQLHALISGDATASGESRKQARTDFESSVTPTARAVEQAGRWLLETLLAMAGLFSGSPGRYAAYRATFTCRIDVGPISADEMRVAKEMKDAELWSEETAIARTGIDDVAAEQERIAVERSRRQQPSELDQIQTERARLNLERDRAQDTQDPLNLTDIDNEGDLT